VKFSRQTFEKFSNTKFHENMSAESRIVPCGRTDGLTNMTKLIVAFQYFADAHKSSLFAHGVCLFVIYNSPSKQRLSP